MSFIKGSSCNTFTFLSVLPALMTHIFFQSKCIHLQQEQEGSKLAPITFPPSLPLKGMSFVLPLSAFKLGPLSLSVNYTLITPFAYSTELRLKEFVFAHPCKHEQELKTCGTSTRTTNSGENSRPHQER